MRVMGIFQQLHPLGRVNRTVDHGPGTFQARIRSFEPYHLLNFNGGPTSFHCGPIQTAIIWFGVASVLPRGF